MVKCFFLLCSLFVLLLHNNALSGTHYSRTGQDIDKIERRYFELFPSVRAVESIVLPNQSDAQQDSVRILLRRASYTTDTTVTLPQHTFQQLIFYINHFEQIYAGQETVQWKLIEEFVRAYSPLLPQRTITITTADKKRFSAFLCAVTDSALICYTAKDWTQWQNYNDSNIVVLPFYKIESVQQRFIGKNFHLFTLAEPMLKEHQIFLALPPEIQSIYNQQSATFRVPAEALDAPDEMLRKLFPPKRFHFSAALGVFTFSIEPPLYTLIKRKTSFFDNTPPEGIDNHAVYPLPSVDVAFSAFHRWSLGFSYAALPSIESVTTAFPEYDSIAGRSKGPVKRYQKKFEGNSFALYAAYAFVKPNPYLDVPLEMNIAAGAIIMDVSIFSLSRNMSLPYNLVTSTNNQTILMPYTALHIDYFFSKTVSLRGRFDAVLSGSIEDNSLLSNAEEFQRKEKVSIPLTRVSASLGVALHF